MRRQPVKVYNQEQKSLEWHELRRGKITSTGLKRIIGTPAVKKTYFMEVLAERLSINDNQDESALDRGVRLESKAIEAFEKYSGKIITQVGLCESDENQFMALSPDGLIENNGVYDEAIEVKCLSSANHIKAWLSNEIPDEYQGQCLQYFIVNPDLKTLYFVLYDPRVTMHPIHVIELTREVMETEILAAKEAELKFIADIEAKISELVTL